MQIKVKYSFQHDLDNYLDALYDFKWIRHGRKDIQDNLLKPFPDDFKRSLKKAESKDKARNIILKFLEGGFEGRKKKYLSIAKDLEKQWDISGYKIINRLEEIYGKKFLFKAITLYLSSIPICPYNFSKKWIMVFAGTSTKRQIEILTHELNHFMFLYHFGDLKKKLGTMKFESLKESLTILTNLEEKGYPDQQKMRSWLKTQKGTVSDIIKTGEWRKHL